MDALIPGQEPATNWRKDVNVLSGVKDGNISFMAIERSTSHMERLLNTVKMCGDAWAELGRLVIWLCEHKVPL